MCFRIAFCLHLGFLFFGIAQANKFQGGLGLAVSTFQPDAQGQGMATRLTAETQSGFSSFLNPAGLAEQEKFHFSSSGAALLFDQRYYFLGGSFPIHRMKGWDKESLSSKKKKKWGGLGLGWAQFRTTEIESTYFIDSLGNLKEYQGDVNLDSARFQVSGGYSAKDDLFILAYGVPIAGFFKFGVGLKFLQRELAGHKGHGFGGDLGGQFLFPGNKFRAGILLKNIFGLPLAWEDQELGGGDTLPEVLLVHMTGRFPTGWCFSLEGSRILISEVSARFGLGGEYLILDKIPIRIGAAEISFTSLEFLEFRMGTGLNLGPLTLNYSFAGSRQFGTRRPHRFSIDLAI